MAELFKPAFLTVQQAAKELQLHEMTVYRMFQKRQLPGVKIGGRWRIHRELLDRVLKGEKP